MADLNDAQLQAAFEVWQLTGWNAGYQIAFAEFERSWRASPVRKCLFLEDRLVAVGRANSDGVLYAMIHDIVVHPDYRGRGLGRRIVIELVEHLRTMGVKSIQLMSARGQVGFYRALGFVERPGDGPGMQFVGQKGGAAR